MQPVRTSVGGQVFAGQASQRLRRGGRAVDAHDLDDLTRGEAEELERLQRARRLSPTPVGQDDPLPLRELARHDHHGPRAAAQDLGERLVRLLLGLEVKMRLPGEGRQVAALRLSPDPSGGVADVL